jgi:putative hydrolase of the HAD superfamily
VFSIIQNTDKLSDRYNEISGKKLKTELMYKHILINLGISPLTISDDLIQEIKVYANNLFLNFQPLFLNNEITNILDNLVDKGYSINLSSNTGFIEGDIINETLRNLDIHKYFRFLVYSDKIFASKPSSDFFNEVFIQSNFQKQEIIHIGDNYIADYKGAINFGFNALHINQHQYNINDITKHL